jgi:hypothetical protein
LGKVVEKKKSVSARRGPEHPRRLEKEKRNTTGHTGSSGTEIVAGDKEEKENILGITDFMVARRGFKKSLDESIGAFASRLHSVRSITSWEHRK